MLSKEDNDLLCRVGPGTPMGELMRQYWIPALLPSDLPEPDCDPVRVRLLGENLIAFRDSSGRAGLLDNECPHRCASLFYGRNEENGIRCVYHGWKFDVTGRCVDMPNEPDESNFKDRVRAIAYPCVEHGGAIWAYMGPRSEPPPLPDIYTNVGAGSQHPSVSRTLRECNWMQGLEGDIDTSHTGFLHRTFGRDAEPGTWEYYLDRNRAPKYLAADTEYGTIYGAYRPAEEDSYYWRIGQFLMPFYTMPGTGVLGGPGGRRGQRAWVPLDDENTMFWSFGIRLPDSDAASGGRGPGSGVPAFPPMRYLPDTSDWLGRAKLAANSSNDYQIDRSAQRTKTYTGIGGIHLQDQAITESMGGVQNRFKEHLSTSDMMVIRTRLRLINAARELHDSGATPPGVDQPEVYRVRSGGVVLPRDADWLQATEDLRRLDLDEPVGPPLNIGLV
jgi:phenylpropionate dioxygenase-like ring-hydroxylating dioxygenase large terminal subunit